jgi:putative transposase
MAEEQHDGAGPRGAARRNAREAGAKEDSHSRRTRHAERKDGGKKGDAYGYDAGKKIAGRKRHLLVDTDGLLLSCVVHGADVQDRDGARSVLRRLHGRAPLLQRIWADGAYAGALVGWAREFGDWIIEIVRKAKGQKGFAVIPRRWVVERTFAWITRCRRLAKEYDTLSASSECWIHLSMIGLMLRRLT